MLAVITINVVIIKAEQVDATKRCALSKLHVLRKILLWFSFLTLPSGQLELSTSWTIYSKKHLFSVLMAFDLPAFDLQNIKRKTL